MTKRKNPATEGWKGRINPSTPQHDAMRKVYVRGLDSLRGCMDRAEVAVPSNDEGYVFISRETWREMMDTLDGLREISSPV